MSTLTFARNPLHPILNDVPSAMTPASLVFDVIGTLTGDDRLEEMSRFALIGALVGGLPAALAGLADYGSLPADSGEKRMATVHGALNAGLMGLTALNLWLRRDGRTGTVPMAIGALANAGMLVSGWMGSRLVYGDGVGVAGHAGSVKVEGGEGI